MRTTTSTPGSATTSTVPSTTGSTTGPTTGRRTARTSGAALVTGALVLVPALAASAHVRVSAEDPTAGGYSVLTFRVPNESDTAGTTQVAVELPTDTPITSVSVEPVPGWSADVVRGDLPEPVAVEGGEVTEAVLSVTWTAEDGVQIGPGEFQRFVVSAGPLPADGTDVVLPTTQTYSDGEVVAWDTPAVPGEEEPETPAPQFTTVAAAQETGGGATTADAATTTDAEAASATTGSSTALWLSGGALALGVVAVLVALAGTATRRRPGR
ncbi:YcnI family protein [Pseudokineococcus basanitobsidens]|uniref:YcnI family protein n=1 Tax=Pseudokineococcus basanitobsidens TaxID=1926649 RepID=A0ABU8RK74_9ACTN